MSNDTFKIPDGYRVDWVAEDMIKITPDTSEVKFKYKFGDKVMHAAYGRCIIDGLIEQNHKPYYRIRNYTGSIISEDRLEPIESYITEQIKTFQDACEWCQTYHGDIKIFNEGLKILNDYKIINGTGAVSDDVIAFLKLRIITFVLNEGKQPCESEKFEKVYYVYGFNGNDGYEIRAVRAICGQEYMRPTTLLFKSDRVAHYAAEQFKDIYEVFGHQKFDGKNL